MPSREAFERWFLDYGRAWEQQDADAAAALFSDDACYYETPFDLVATDREGVRCYWREGDETHRDVRFEFRLLSVQEDEAIAHWTAEYRYLPSGTTRKLDGIMKIALDSSGTCRELRRFVNVYVNGEDVRFLAGMATALKAGDEVSIVPAVAGG